MTIRPTTENRRGRGAKIGMAIRTSREVRINTGVWRDKEAETSMARRGREATKNKGAMTNK